MKNDMAKSHPDQRLPSGKPLPRETDKGRCRQRKACVSPRLPVTAADGNIRESRKRSSRWRAVFRLRQGEHPSSRLERAEEYQSIYTAANSVAAGNNLDLHPLTEVRHRTKSAFRSSPSLVAGDEMFQFGNLFIRQRIFRVIINHYDYTVKSIIIHTAVMIEKVK